MRTGRIALQSKVGEMSKQSGNAVVFLHGFPEIWYSWRHQMITLAYAGFRTISFDYRGYGLPDPPPHPDNTTKSFIFFKLFNFQSIRRPFSACGYVAKCELDDIRSQASNCWFNLRQLLF
ncbi:hypothetical protein VNO80_03048 [Phaseolus coccineus]|uniref:AB hydrolase-1 domain-containing protein n=1 Tax=Phaseolus coccineus TaxID=3886 RepID=A0AAN9NW31_PHACN